MNHSSASRQDNDVKLITSGRDQITASPVQWGSFSLLFDYHVFRFSEKIYFAGFAPMAWDAHQLLLPMLPRLPSLPPAANAALVVSMVHPPPSPVAKTKKLMGISFSPGGSDCKTRWKGRSDTFTLNQTISGLPEFGVSIADNKCVTYLPNLT